MKQVSITVNGKDYSAEVSPRTSLADFLRDQLKLTGTHLGCEHGVCGACTVNVNGAPARSCITYAVSCDGDTVRTIEGFDDDPLMGELRKAFSKHHGLQCGYCTPGMMITSRDIVQRLPDADEERVRKELSGNLCRCTGYMGIVGAVIDVKDRWDGRPDTIESGKTRKASKKAAPKKSSQAGIAEQIRNTKMTRLDESFTVSHPREKVWEIFEDLPTVAACMPGATLAGEPVDGHVEGNVAIKMGPIRAEFAGEADVETNSENFTGLIRGAGLDKGHASKAFGEVGYALEPAAEGKSTKVDIEIAFALTGPLAQFSRSGIVKTFVEQLTKNFAENLETKISGGDVDNTNKNSELNVSSLMLSVFKSYFRKLAGKLRPGKE